MDDRVNRALTRGHRIDITTTGRRTGKPRRIEIVFHNMDGRLIITGMPRADRRRAWLLNLEADPRMTFHLKGAVAADLPAIARVITDATERRAIAEWITTHAWQQQDADAMTAYAPMIEVTLDEATSTAA
jgi:deazaflavin-dependent oxidoreductase (nitroreductase family)